MILDVIAFVHDDKSDPFCRDAEVMLDLQVAGAMAPGANILVYFARDDSDESFLAAMSAIVHDTERRPDIISISWGGPEPTATGQFREDFDQLLQSAAHLGITVCAATGDNDLGFHSFYKHGWKRFYLKWYDHPLPSADANCPRSVALLRSIPSIKGAMFATLPPGGKHGALHAHALAVDHDVRLVRLVVLVDLSQAEQFPGDLDRPLLGHLAYPQRGAPSPRSEGIRPEIELHRIGQRFPPG